MPGRMRRAAALGATAKVASNRGQAKGAAAAEQAAAAAAAPPVPPAAPAAPAAPVAAEPTSTGAVDNYDALMKLKGLLDAGVLSQEEFDAEKRKMLGA
mgnify:CR=1 FL=1